ncbi:MAG: hypothetical protein NT031_15700, partial [Planctomycetota bacterium]|nr:hypothetical protein [Planctomycetota bacterium]
MDGRWRALPMPAAPVIAPTATTGVAPALGGVPPATRPADDGMITVNFPENLDVKALMDYVNKRLGMKIICDASLASRRVTVISQARIPKDSVLSLIQSVLKVSGLALVDADEPGWKQVVPTTDLMAVSRGMPTDAATLADAQATTVVTQTFVPRYVSLSVIEGAIRPFLSKPGGNMFVVPDRNMLFVTDYAPNVRRAAALIPVLDQPGQKTKLRFVPIKNRLAATVATQVTALLQKRQAASGRGETRGGQITVTDEPGTNQVVIIAPDGEESEAIKLIEMFDTPANTQLQTYHFEHISPVRVDTLMRKFLETSISGKTYHSVIDAESG